MQKHKAQREFSSRSKIRLSRCEKTLVGMITDQGYFFVAGIRKSTNDLLQIFRLDRIVFVDDIGAFAGFFLVVSIAGFLIFCETEFVEFLII